VSLGRSLGRGGEGEVFMLPSLPGSAAKIYHQPLEPARAQKIAAMATLPAKDLLRVAAWPTATLHAKPGGQVSGLVMPLVEKHRELHVLYGPAQRRQEFPEASWEFLVHVALNTARAFATVHQAGHVLGDVNQKNVVVSKDGTVKLIDCDSFQINAHGKRFLCEVGVAHFTPPELHGHSFSGVIRSQNHDRFGLAVLIFHLLFMGRHPFVGVYQDGKGDMPLERAIQEGRYAYGRDAARYQMRPPPNAVAPPGLVTPHIVAMLEQAFALRSNGERPTSEDWVRALTQLSREIRKCSSHPGHRHVGTVCPWCAIERAGGPDFFVTLSVMASAGTGGTWDLNAFLREVARISQPPPTLSQHLRTPPRKAGVTAVSLVDSKTQTVSQALYAAGVLAVVGGFAVQPLLFVIAFAFVIAGQRAGEKAKTSPQAIALRDAHARSLMSHKDALAAYERCVEEPAQQFRAKEKELQKTVTAYRNIDVEMQSARQKLDNDQHRIQLRHHLERHYIRSASLNGVGPQLRQTLASYGIETAADLSRSSIQRVPGFGPTRTQALLTWRASVEARFVFNPKKGVDPSDIAQLQREFGQKRQKLQVQIQKIAGEMRNLSQRIRGQEQDLLSRLTLNADTVATVKAKLGIS
jgi:DNA-binding helix-hairpin-helix protein with protein kinase domain